MKDEKEIWATPPSIKDLRGIQIQVSNLGNVRYCLQGHEGDYKPRSVYHMGGGYNYKVIYAPLKDVPDKGKTVRINRLVAECFVPNPNNYNFVTFKNGNVEDCSAANLEYIANPWCVTVGNINARRTPFYLYQRNPATGDFDFLREEKDIKQVAAFVNRSPSTIYAHTFNGDTEWIVGDILINLGPMSEQPRIPQHRVHPKTKHLFKVYDRDGNFIAEVPGIVEVNKIVGLPYKATKGIYNKFYLREGAVYYTKNGYSIKYAGSYNKSAERAVA